MPASLLDRERLEIVADPRPSMADEVWLLRHAETEWSRTGKHTGRTDIPLTDKGREVARGLRARAWTGTTFALVLCSPLSRARETAQLAGLECSAAARRPHRVGLRRLRGADHAGDPRAASGLVPVARRRARRRGARRRRRARCDRVIAEARAVEGDVALVAHGHILRALAARWVDEPSAFGGRLFLGTGTMSVLGFERDVQVIRTWNH